MCDARLPTPDKATEQWEKFGKAPQGNWKHRIYVSEDVYLSLWWVELIVAYVDARRKADVSGLAMALLASTYSHTCRDRVDYEEWLLKALDASAAPKLLTRRPKPGDLSEGTATSSSEDEQIPLYFPSSFMSDSEVLQDLKQMLGHREPHHNDLMKKSLYVARKHKSQRH